MLAKIKSIEDQAVELLGASLENKEINAELHYLLEEARKVSAKEQAVLLAEKSILDAQKSETALNTHSLASQNHIERPGNNFAVIGKKLWGLCGILLNFDKEKADFRHVGPEELFRTLVRFEAEVLAKIEARQLLSTQKSKKFKREKRRKADDDLENSEEERRKKLERSQRNYRAGAALPPVRRPVFRSVIRRESDDKPKEIHQMIQDIDAKYFDDQI